MALDNLYTQYKADGKLDASNINNLINMLQLVNSCSQLKEYKTDKSYLTSFAKGLIVGSLNVNQNNSMSVTNQLAGLMSNTNTQSLTSALTGMVQQGTQTTGSALSSVLAGALSNAQTKTQNTTTQTSQQAQTTASNIGNTVATTANTVGTVASSVSTAANSITSLFSLFKK